MIRSIVDASTFARCIHRTKYDTKRPIIGNRTETYVYLRQGAEVGQATYVMRRGKRVEASGQFLLESEAIVPYDPWFDWNGEHPKSAEEAILAWCRSSEGKRAFGCNAGMRDLADGRLVVCSLESTEPDPERFGFWRSTVFADGETWEEVASKLVAGGKMPAKGAA